MEAVVKVGPRIVVSIKVRDDPPERLTTPTAPSSITAYTASCNDSLTMKFSTLSSLLFSTALAAPATGDPWPPIENGPGTDDFKIVKSSGNGCPGSNTDYRSGVVGYMWGGGPEMPSGTRMWALNLPFSKILPRRPLHVLRTIMQGRSRAYSSSFVPLQPRQARQGTDGLHL